jgi:hypothetical protein
MYNSTLKRKTPLKQKTALKAYTPLKAKKSLRQCQEEKAKRGEVKKTYAKPYKPKHRYESIFTKDLKRCFITGAENGFSDGEYHDIHIHHIFGASNKANSEKYHYVIPLRDDWHNMASYGVHIDRNLDLALKQICQEDFIKYHGSRTDFIKIFGKFWTGGGDEISRYRQRLSPGTRKAA